MYNDSWNSIRKTHSFKFLTFSQKKPRPKCTRTTQPHLQSRSVRTQDSSQRTHCPRFEMTELPGNNSDFGSGNGEEDEPEPDVESSTEEGAEINYTA